MNRNTRFAFALIFAASFAAARAPGKSVQASGRSGAFRSRSRPSFARVASRTGFAAAPGKGRAAFANSKLMGATGGSGSSSSNTPPGDAAVGSKILTLGQAPVYSNPGGGGTASVQGGGFVAIDPARANDVGRGPGITWGKPDNAPSSGASGGGSGASSNGPAAFDPSF
jgi:hypothetical protein